VPDGRSDDGTCRQSADDAGSDRAAVARFGRLRGGDGRDSKGRSGRESSECSGHFSHGAPSFGSLSSYAFNDRSNRFLRIAVQHQPFVWMRGSCFSREQWVNDLFGIDAMACLRRLNFCNACGSTKAIAARERCV
jgi:hypothetical protein